MSGQLDLTYLNRSPDLCKLTVFLLFPGNWKFTPVRSRSQTRKRMADRLRKNLTAPGRGGDQPLLTLGCRQPRGRVPDRHRQLDIHLSHPLGKPTRVHNAALERPRAVRMARQFGKELIARVPRVSV